MLNNVERKFSPDGRFFVLLGAYEMRMSHWVTAGALWEVGAQQVLLSLGPSLWSTEKCSWSADSSCLLVVLRRYPGDAPTIELEVFPDRQIVLPRLPAGTGVIPFEKLDGFLENFYEKTRRKTADG